MPVVRQHLSWNDCYFDKFAKFDFSLPCVQWHHKEQLSTWCEISNGHLDHLRSQNRVYGGQNLKMPWFGQVTQQIVCLVILNKKVYDIVCTWPSIKKLLPERSKGQRTFIRWHNTLMAFRKLIFRGVFLFFVCILVKCVTWAMYAWSSGHLWVHQDTCGM